MGRAGWTRGYWSSLERTKPVRGWWLTLTAPGRDVLPFDVSQCSHSAGVKCSGDIGCVVEADALANWHFELALDWTHFVTELRRSLNPGLDGPPSSWPVRVEFFKTYEPQKRGALHVHCMMRVSGVVADRRLLAAVSKARRLNGFGVQSKCEPIDMADDGAVARKAGYCAKYAGKSADHLPTVERRNAITGETFHGGLRAWSCSRGWGLTMAAVRARRRSWAASGGERRADDEVAAGAAAGGALDLYRDSYASGWERMIGLVVFVDALRGSHAV